MFGSAKYVSGRSILGGIGMLKVLNLNSIARWGWLDFNFVEYCWLDINNCIKKCPKNFIEVGIVIFFRMLNVIQILIIQTFESRYCFVISLFYPF